MSLTESSTVIKSTVNSDMQVCSEITISKNTYREGISRVIGDTI